MEDHKKQIEYLWEHYKKWPQNSEARKKAKKSIQCVISLIDKGKIRVCTQDAKGDWVVHEWVKKAILLMFAFQNNSIIVNNYMNYYDKIPPKFHLAWEDNDFEMQNFRIVPGSYIRKGAYIGRDVVIMPCFVNIGAYIDDGSMIDSWANIGSCANIGKNCHISSGVNIGGVLEPCQAMPVIIEDECFIGSGCNIVEGVRIGKGSVLGMGVNISASSKIIVQETGEVIYGYIPEYSVVVPGSVASKNGVNYQCSIIIKQVDSNTRAKTEINELLRS